MPNDENSDDIPQWIIEEFNSLKQNKRKLIDRDPIVEGVNVHFTLN